jgi:integrase
MNLPACVYHKHGAYWYVKRGKWTRLAADLSDALEAYARIIDSPSGTMPALIDDALVQIKSKVKASTFKQYEAAARKLKKAFVEFAPQQVQPRHVAAFKLGMAKTPNMANRCLSVLRQAFDYALEAQVIDSNPAVGVRRHKERKRDRLITADEYEAIYAKAGPRLQIIMDLLIRTGQRITAVLRIMRSDLTDDGIRFPKHKTDGKGTVKWTPELRAVVDRALALHGKVSYMTLLFNRRRKAPDYRSVRDQWEAACKAAGVADAHIHDLRAVAGTTAEEQGLNPQALLMHSSPQNTQRYLRSKKEPKVQGPSFRQSVRQPGK